MKQQGERSWNTSYLAMGNPSCKTRSFHSPHTMTKRNLPPPLQPLQLPSALSRCPLFLLLYSTTLSLRLSASQQLIYAPFDEQPHEPFNPSKNPPLPLQPQRLRELHISLQPHVHPGSTLLLCPLLIPTNQRLHVHPLALAISIHPSQANTAQASRSTQ